MNPLAAANSPIRIRVESSLVPRLSELSQGRALVIDCFASRRCGVTIGDVTVTVGSNACRFGLPRAGPARNCPGPRLRAPPGPARAGAELRLGGPVVPQRLRLSIDRPEGWVDFLERHHGKGR
jgi:hypothetical protein